MVGCTGSSRRTIDTGSGQILLKSAILGSVFAIALWVAWVLLVYVILTQVFRAQADVQQLVRTMGMATVPLALTVLMFLPEISFGIALASVALLFGLTTMAVQAATNASPRAGAGRQRGRLCGLGDRADDTDG